MVKVPGGGWAGGLHAGRVRGGAGRGEVGGVILLGRGYRGGDWLYIQHVRGISLSTIQSCHDGNILDLEV